jgi:hypothetical protein
MLTPTHSCWDTKWGLWGRIAAVLLPTSLLLDAKKLDDQTYRWLSLDS